MQKNGKLASMANGFLGQQSNNYCRIMGTRDAEARFSRKKDHPEQAKCHIVKVGSPLEPQ